MSDAGATRPRLGLLGLLLLPVGGCPVELAEAPARPAEQRAEVREELRRELRAEVREELRRELRAEVREELCRERRAGARAERPAEPPQPAGRAPAGPGTQAGDPPADDHPPGSPPTDRGPPPLPTAGRGLAAPPTPTPAEADSEDLPPDQATPPASTLPVTVPVGLPEPRLEIVDATLARQVVDRLPIDRGIHFPANGEPVYVFTILGNPKGPPTFVRFVWRHKGAARAESRVHVGVGARWRTWAYHAIPAQQSGDWTVEIQSDSGVILKTLPFTARP